jgi:hypothetical protein
LFDPVDLESRHVAGQSQRKFKYVTIRGVNEVNVFRAGYLWQATGTKKGANGMEDFG